MKKSLLFLGFCAYIVMLSSCKEDTLNYLINIPEQQADNSIKNIFAYVDNGSTKDTLDVTIKSDSILLVTRPVKQGDPAVDITKVKIAIGLTEGSTKSPELGAPVDLSTPISLAVTSFDGSTRNYTIKVMVSKPLVVFPKLKKTMTELWVKTGEDLGLKFPSEIKGMTVSGDYLLVMDAQLDPSSDRKIKVYDKSTGAFIKNVASYPDGDDQPRTYTFNIETDDAGHFAAIRINSGGAGFMLDYYENIDAAPQLILNCLTNNSPVHTGRKVRIVGNLKEGKAYVYATVAGYLWGTQVGPPKYCVWEFNDGIVKSEIPTEVTYAGAIGWWSASIQQLSIDDPTLYLMYCNEANYPNDPFDQWETVTASQFELFKPGSGAEPVKMSPLNHKYRILDNRVFSVSGGKFLALLQQTYSAAGDMTFKAFDITNPEDMDKVPGDEDYDGFAFYESLPVSSKPSNDARYGAVAVSVEENDAYLYVYYPALSRADATIQAYKLSVEAE